MSIPIRYSLLAGIATVAAFAMAVALIGALHPALISEAAGIEKSGEGIGPALKVINALRGPALAIGASVAVLAIIGAGLMILIGNRQGMRIAGFVVAGSALLACAAPLAN